MDPSDERSLHRQPTNGVGDHHFAIGATGHFQADLRRRDFKLAEIVSADLRRLAIELDRDLLAICDEFHVEAAQRPE